MLLSLLDSCNSSFVYLFIYYLYVLDSMSNPMSSSLICYIVMATKTPVLEKTCNLVESVFVRSFAISLRVCIPLYFCLVFLHINLFIWLSCQLQSHIYTFHCNILISITSLVLNVSPPPPQHFLSYSMGYPLACAPAQFFHLLLSI